MTPDCISGAIVSGVLRRATPRTESNRPGDWECSWDCEDCRHAARARALFHGGSGAPLVFLHGAGGVTAADPFLARLAAKFRVFAPLLPGYGDSEECAALRDMLDFTLHTWDVVETLGLRDPILSAIPWAG